MKQTLKEIREEQYAYNVPSCLALGVDINDFKGSPYTFLKMRFYIETSVVLLYFLLQTNIKPNTITIVYCLCGIIGGLMLSIPHNYTIIFALLVFFSKSVFDNMDGHIARVKGLTSITGHILDIYGTQLNSLGFHIGLGMYVASKTDMFIFYYLIIIYLFFRAGSLSIFSKYVMFEDISSEKNVASFLNKRGKDNVEPELIGDSYKKLKNIFFGILDDRARSVDFICLIILLEIFTQINISWFLFLIIVAKFLIIFIAAFYIIGKGGWAENEMNKKLRRLHRFLVDK